MFVIPSAARNLIWIGRGSGQPAQGMRYFIGSTRSLKSYWGYILASTSRTLYPGVTNDLLRRVHEHKTGNGSQFTAKYRIRRLVHFEETNDVRAAIAREKQIKGRDRQKKVALIEATHPNWDDLAAGWYDTTDSSRSWP